MRTAIALLLVACGNHSGGNTIDSGTSGDTSTTTPDTAELDAPLPPPSTYPRLLVAGAHGVAIWNNVDKLAADGPPDATLAGLDRGALGIGVHDNILYVTSPSPVTPLYRFANASMLATGAMPASSLSTASMGTDFSISALVALDASGNLWIASGGRLHLVASAATATAATAHFTHPFEQIMGMAYDDVGGRLFGGQISGAGLLAWNAAATKTGTISAPDYTLSSVTGWHTTIAGNRLYTSAFSPPTIRIWDNISTTSAARMPDHTLTAMCGPGQSAELRYTAIEDDRLIAIHAETVGGTQVEKICIWNSASMLDATRLPDAVAEHASLMPAPSAYDKAVLTKDGHLFVLDRTGVVVFKDALTSPVFVTKLFTGLNGARDLLVLE